LRGYSGVYQGGYPGGYHTGDNGVYVGGYSGGYHKGYAGVYQGGLPGPQYPESPVRWTTEEDWEALRSAPPPEGAASIDLRVPAEAEVWFENQKTRQSGPIRHFTSPPLPQGQRFVYDLRARWTENGRVITRTRRLPIRAGDHLRIDLRPPTESNSQRRG
jgi:uncharacterized protein (TIGR03000 family)